MPHRTATYSEEYGRVMQAMTSRGLLLGSYNAEHTPNIMTIGWGSVGSIWGMPVWSVLVRPSRYTYANIEHTGCFTVNVPRVADSYACAECGTLSGRDVDKFARCKLTAEQAGNVLAPRVAECPIIYECQVVHSNDVLPDKLADEILSGAYIDGDYHRVYYGKILATHIDDDALADLDG
jgi:flavin reductase (DIM6/NTAB) family NADH-FMN oxidoreductase RutF